MTRELICISCPLGCHLTAQVNGEEIIVSGNQCPRGAVYAKSEITRPKRMVTASVKVDGSHINMVSVKTSEAIDRHLIFDSLRLLQDVTLSPPIKIGQVVVANVLGSGVDFVATKEITN